MMGYGGIIPKFNGMIYLILVLYLYVNLILLESALLYLYIKRM